MCRLIAWLHLPNRIVVVNPDETIDKLKITESKVVSDASISEKVDETKSVVLDEQFQALLVAIKGNATEINDKLDSSLTALSNEINGKMHALGKSIKGDNVQCPRLVVIYPHSAMTLMVNSTLT